MQNPGVDCPFPELLALTLFVNVIQLIGSIGHGKMDWGESRSTRYIDFHDSLTYVAFSKFE